MNQTRKGSLLIIFITVFVDLLGFGIVMPLLPRYGKYYEAHELTLGLLLASFSAMQFLFAPLWGRLSDHIGRRPVLMLGLAGSTVAYALFGMASSLDRTATILGLGPLPWLFMTRIGAGIAGATIPTAQAYIADVTEENERARGMALIGAAFGIGFTFGPLLGAFFVSGDLDSPPSSAPGYLASVLSGLALLSAIFILKESLPQHSKPDSSNWMRIKPLFQALSRPKVGIILLAMFFSTFALSQLEVTLALLTEYLQMDEQNNYLVFAYVGFISAIGHGVLVRRLVPKLGEHLMALIGTICMTIGLLSVLLVIHFQSALLLYLLLPIGVIGFTGVTPSLQSLLSRNTSDSEQGGILGAGQSISALARITGPVVGIVLFTWEIRAPYLESAAFMFLTALIIMSLRSKADRAAAVPAETVVASEIESL